MVFRRVRLTLACTVVLAEGEATLSPAAAEALLLGEQPEQGWAEPRGGQPPPQTMASLSAANAKNALARCVAARAAAEKASRKGRAGT